VVDQLPAVRPAALLLFIPKDMQAAHLQVPVPQAVAAVVDHQLQAMPAVRTTLATMVEAEQGQQTLLQEVQSLTQLADGQAV
jgi:hypothetical protein